MRRKQLNIKGFAPLVLLIAVAAVLVVGGGGAYVYHRNHKPKAPVASTTTNTKTSTQTGKSSTTATANLYAGWKSYCDTTYHYCFKYPTDWTLDQGIALSPSKAVQVAYANPDTRDGGLLEFSPSYVGKLSGANQDVTVIGGYYTTGGNYSPTYAVVDSSMLTTSPLTVGTQAQFPGNPSFTDQGSESRGQLTSTPAVSISSVSDAQAWLNSADAKTSLQILQSFDYQ
jgi:hypothetical protein